MRRRLRFGLTMGLVPSLLVLSGLPALAGTKTDRVFDSGFAPLHLIKMMQGSKVQWYFDSSNQHDHVLSSFFFTSANQAPNTLFTKQFGGAGTYTITDSPSGDTMQVQVRELISPTSGSCETTFTLQGGTIVPGKSFAYTYQVLVPGGAWEVLSANTPDLSLPYTPGAGCVAGTYKFRALSALADHPKKHSDYSRNVLVTVTSS